MKSALASSSCSRWRPCSSIGSVTSGVPLGATHGRFWTLAGDFDGEGLGSSAGEEEDDREEGEVGSLGEFGYLCRLPSPEGKTSICDRLSQEEKRIAKRLAQRYVNVAMRCFSPEKLSVVPDLVIPRTELKRPSRRLPFGRQAELKLPVLEPSVSTDDGSGGWEIVHRLPVPVMRR